MIDNRTVTTDRRHSGLQQRTDAGAILPLVLVFVVVLSVVVAALVNYTATALRTTEVADQNISRLSAAESAMQFALREAADNPASCNGAAVVRPAINDSAIQTQCWRVAELDNLDTLFALVMTGEGPGGSPVTQQALTVGGANSDSGVKDISGPIYFGAPGGAYLSTLLENARAVIPDPSAPANRLPGVVRFEPATGACPTPGAPMAPAAWNGTPSLPPQITCDEREWDDIVPDLDFSDPAFAASVTTAAPAPDMTDPACHIYSPGLYATPPTLTAASFFRSGIYYFPTGEVRIDKQTVVGKRTSAAFPDAATAGISAACTPHWNADADDSGAVWIMGSDARIFTFGNTAKLSMYGREIADLGSPPQTADRTVVALTGAQATNANSAGLPTVTGVTLGINGAVSPAPPKLVDRQNGSTSSMSFYGQVFAPHSWVDTGNAAGGVFVEFLGGIVAGRLTIKTAANVDGFVITVPTNVINAFYIESRATTNGPLGPGASTVRTRSKQETGVSPAPDQLSVDSWRVCERGNC